MKTIDCEFLVIGSGLAGLMSALHLSRHGQVILASKKELGESNSNYAQGGIACAIDPDDSVDDHVEDTLRVGGGLSKPDVVRAIAAAGPERIRELEDLGVRFERRVSHGDDYDLGQEGGHSRRRVLHAGDITGHEIIKVLRDRVSGHPQITLCPHLMAIDLVTTGWLKIPGESRCIGAYFLDPVTREISAVRASATVLATGGAGKVYLYTSNPDVATGDGVAMAWRVGLPIR
ncbi:MAG: FAD-dependent oxidoreductase, partial [Lentisphaerota bacterium]